MRDWQRLRIASDLHLVKVFGRAHTNIGIILGEPSGWIVDIDLDCDEAIRLAPRILPPTLMFGRPSKPCSHWLYRSRVEQTEKWQGAADPTTKKAPMLLEMRSSGGQTVLPGSIHPSGELISWHDGAVEPTEIAPAELRAVCILIANMIRLERGQPIQAPPALPKVKPRQSLTRFEGYDKASAAYCADHPLPEKCPFCKRKDAWKRKDGRWFCFHSGHDPGLGGAGRGCYTGDVLDIEAWGMGKKRGEILRADGYL
jgi:hypothetical protein